MWTVVYVAPNKEQADKIQEALSREGLLVKVRQVEPENTDQEEELLMEIMVPETEADEALEVINLI